MSDSPEGLTENHSGGGRLTRTQWAICIIASIGFAFDIYELLMLPLIVKPAIAALSGASPTDASWLPGGQNYVNWARAFFFVPALAGGAFGLLGGYLTDRFGRRRVLTWSILLYAFSACAAGFATTLPQLLFFRCLVFIGVCVEFVAAVAWLAELFPDPKRRERVLGYTQAFSSLGGAMVAFVNKGAALWALSLPAIHGGHEAWRYTLISGVIPALPLIFIRPFLPESPVWAKKRAEGTLKRPSIFALFAPDLRRTTIITTLVFASTFGLAFGAIQQATQIVPGHAKVQSIAAEEQGKRRADTSRAAPTPRELGQIRGNSVDSQVATITGWQEIGGLVGRILLAVVIVRMVSKRATLRLFQIPALIFVPLLFWWFASSLNDPASLAIFQWGMFIAGVLVISQMSFWGNYIPLVFPVHLRGTGESFAANIGGRVLGTAAAFLTITLAPIIPGTASGNAKTAMAAAIVATVYGLVGAVATFWLPEPKEMAHEHG